MKKIFLSFLLVFLFIPVHTLFAQTTSISVPQPIGDFVDSLKGINIDNINQKISNNISLDGSAVEQKISDMGIQGIWDSANTWMENTIGISLGQIIKAIGNLIMWVLELMIGLIKGGMNEIGA